MTKANVQVGEVKVSEKTIEEQTQETIERSLEILKKNGSDLEQLRQKVIKTAEDVNSIMSGYVYKGIEKMRGQIGTKTGINSQIKARKEALKELSYTDDEIKVDNIISSLQEQKDIIANKIKAESQREVLYDFLILFFLRQNYQLSFFLSQLVLTFVFHSCFVLLPTLYLLIF